VTGFGAAELRDDTKTIFPEVVEALVRIYVLERKHGDRLNVVRHGSIRGSRSGHARPRCHQDDASTVLPHHVLRLAVAVNMSQASCVLNGPSFDRCCAKVGRWPKRNVLHRF
jgi:hypothetical protein